MIDDAIYLLLTVLIPLQSTYTSIKRNELLQMKLWSVYWLIFSCVKSLQWF